MNASNVSWPLSKAQLFFLFSINFFGDKLSCVLIKFFFNKLSIIFARDVPGDISNPHFFCFSLTILLHIIKLLFLSHNITSFGIMSIASTSCFNSISLFLILDISDHNVIVLPSLSLVSLNINVIPFLNAVSLIL